MQMAGTINPPRPRMGARLRYFRDRLLRAEWRRARWYPMGGALLACGLPLGLFVVRALQARQWPSATFLARELGELTAVYGYVALSSMGMYTIMGWVLGRNADALKLASNVDALTGLANRRLFNSRMGDELLRVRRYGGSLALLLIDVDGLKEINDARGHPRGDEALAMVAQAVQKNCRATDLAARFGGDEFAIVAPQTAADEARELAERVRREVSLRAQKRALQPLSVSIGVAEVRTVHALDAEALIAAADQALYDAKGRGRNRVVMAPRPSLH